mgnify:CR=1 FL=1
MKYINKIYFKLLLTIILFLISIFIINNQFISNFIWWFPDLFGDLRTPVRWLECANLGYNFYEDSVTFMECAKREFNYGKIFFQVPFSENLKFFYIRILPYLLIFFSIYYIFFHIFPYVFTYFHARPPVSNMKAPYRALLCTTQQVGFIDRSHGAVRPMGPYMGPRGGRTKTKNTKIGLKIGF